MIENKKYLYEHIIQHVAKEVKKYLNESNINLLTDLDDSDLDQLDTIQTKSINNKMIVYTAEIKQFINAIESIKPISYKLKRLFNNPKNFEKFKGIIKATDKHHLERLIDAGQLILGDKGNFNWIDTSNITDMSNLFYQNYTFNGHIELWDVRNVTDMSYMFCDADDFNQPIDNWDVSSVKNMSCLFCNAKSFNQSIKDWDVSNVTNMYGTFFNAKSFNQPIGNWDVSNVENMNCLFNEAKSFNQDLSNWQINTDNIKGMFVRCPIKGKYTPNGIYKGLSESNMNLLTDLDDSDLDQLDSLQAKSVNNKIGIFDMYEYEFIQTIECNLSYMYQNQIDNMKKLSNNCVMIINTPINFERFKGIIKANNKHELIELIAIGRQLLGNCGNFNWIDTSGITDMSDLFKYNNIFNGDISLWDVSNVEDMSFMFFDSCFNGNLSKWDVSNVKNMQFMFRGAEKFTQCDISAWDVTRAFKYIDTNRYCTGIYGAFDNTIPIKYLPKKCVDAYNWILSKNNKI